MYRLASVILSAAFLPACAHPARAASVVPNLPVHLETIQVADTVVYERVTTRAGIDSTTGTRTVVSRVVRENSGSRYLEVVQRFPAGGGEIVDTAVADAQSLRAVAHRSHQPTRVMRFDFASDYANGVVHLRSAAAGNAQQDTVVHQSVGGPPFDSNILELVAASLPLRLGLQAELPFFIYERGGRIPMLVTVQSRRNVSFPIVGARESWVVSVGVPGAPATVWVDVATRAVRRVRYDIAARGVSFSDERRTPLRT
ncbi:MAG: hypothetical protein ABIT38_24705 [Gemmatimonadaceae bacterium]